MDFGFTRFITNTWISIIWGIVIIAHLLGMMVAIYVLFNGLNVVDDGGRNMGIVAIERLLWIAAVPLITVLSLLFFRMVLKLEVIFFRIETNTRETKDLLREIKEQLEKK